MKAKRMRPTMTNGPLGKYAWSVTARIPKIVAKTMNSRQRATYEGGLWNTCVAMSGSNTKRIIPKTKKNTDGATTDRNGDIFTCSSFVMSILRHF